MNNPVMFAVVGDETTRGPLARDLERRFGADYRVIVADSATEGLATLRALRQAGDDVAIVIVAQELPEMTGLAFLDQADNLHATALRGILVNPGPAGMTEPIRRALLLDHLDFQIAVPWVSPEEWLYPTVTDALSTWTRLHRPHDEAVTIVDRRWNPRGHELRDLLERSGVPYGFYEVDSSRGQDLMARHGCRYRAASCHHSPQRKNSSGPVERRAGGSDWRGHPAARRTRRCRDYRRWTSRSGGGRLRRLRGVTDGGRGVRGARRSGGDQQPDS